MSGLKVLHLRSSTGHGGGPEKIIFQIAQNIDKALFDPCCAFIHDERAVETPVYDKALREGIKAFLVKTRGRFSPLMIKNVRRLILDLDIDIIHAHGYKSDIVGALASFGTKVAKVCTVHGFVENDRRLKIYNFLDIQFIKRFERVIAVNDGLKKLLTHRGVSERSIAVIYNGIDENAFSKKNITKDARRELNIQKDDAVILFAGRLSREKGVFFLLKAFSSLIKTVTDATLLIAGSGEEENDLKRYCLESGLSGKVLFLGHRNDIIDLLGCADVFVLPSLTEGIPLSALEAMSMEIPVVATKVGGIPEIIEHEKQGLLIPSSDSDAICKSLASVLENSVKAEEMGKEGRKAVLRKHSIKTAIQKIEDVYREALLK